MDIFKLGDKILALLEVVFGFWNHQIALIFELLGQSPTAFKDGRPWLIISEIEPMFVAVGSSLVVLFFVIGFCSESIDIGEEMRFEVILRILIRLGIAEYMVANNVTIMKAFFTSIGNLVGLLSEGNRTKLTIAEEQAEVIKNLGFGESLDYAYFGSPALTDCNYLWFFSALYGIFPFSEIAGYCTNRLDSIFDNGWKPYGGTYCCHV